MKVSFSYSIRTAATLLLSLVLHDVTSNAQTTNLFPDCGGIAPEAVEQAFPITTGIQNAKVPQRCVPDPTDATKTRCYYVYLPEGLDGEVPLVMDIHGSGSCPVFSSAYTGWAQQALEHQFVLIYPVGVTDPEISDISCWALEGGAKVGGESSTTPTDCCCVKETFFGFGAELVPPQETMDTEILKSMFDDVVTNMNDILPTSNVTIDTTRIYVTGHSNGCIASMALAAVYSESIAAVACYGGSLVTEFAANYSATPVFSVHGLLDGEIPLDGLEFGSLLDGVVGVLPATRDVFHYVADKNGCSPDILWDNTTLGADVGTIQSRVGCTNDANVTLVLLNTAGHTPYLGANDDLSLNPGAMPTTVDTTAMGWEFISQFRLASPAPTGTTRPNDGAPSMSPPGTSGAAGYSVFGVWMMGLVVLVCSNSM